MKNKNQPPINMFFLKENHNEELKRTEYTIDIRGLYGELPFNNGRVSQWFRRSFNKLDKIKEQYATEYTELQGIYDYGLTPNSLVSIKSALLLLIYGENNHLSTDFLSCISETTGQYIPIPPRQSRYEHSFALELNELLDKLNIDNTKEYKLVKQQQRFDRFIVDFHIEEIQSGKNYIIEFDESFHQKPQNTKADRLRDKEIKRNNPDIILIRVRHAESALWINSVIDMNELHSIECMYSNLLLETSLNVNVNVNVKKHQIIISAQSAKETFNTPSLQFKRLIPNSHSQPLSYLGKILDRLSVHYEKKQIKKSRVLVFNKAKLNKYLKYK